MCLRLTYSEGLLWKKESAKLLADAKARSASIACDPLFRSNPRLSSLVSEIDSIKKRHGLLIEKALIFAIDKLPHWEAGKEKIKVASGKAHLDCLAYNSSTRKLYVFECKRGHGSFDGDKIRAIDQRLDSINSAIGAHAKSKGWEPKSTNVFLLSFYGAKWKSSYPIYDRHNIAKLFEPCIGRFVGDYMDHIEAVTARNYSSELRDQIVVPSDNTIFAKLEEYRTEQGLDILFNEAESQFLQT